MVQHIAVVGIVRRINDGGMSDRSGAVVGAYRQDDVWSGFMNAIPIVSIE